MLEVDATRHAQDAVSLPKSYFSEIRLGLIHSLDGRRLEALNAPRI